MVTTGPSGAGDRGLGTSAPFFLVRRAQRACWLQSGNDAADK
jgi:hypothetical protein